MYEVLGDDGTPQICGRTINTDWIPANAHSVFIQLISQSAGSFDFLGVERECGGGKNTHRSILQAIERTRDLVAGGWI